MKEKSSKKPAETEATDPPKNSARELLRLIAFHVVQKLRNSQQESSSLEKLDGKKETNAD